MGRMLEAVAAGRRPPPGASGTEVGKGREHSKNTEDTKPLMGSHAQGKKGRGAPPARRRRTPSTFTPRVAGPMTTKTPAAGASVQG